MSMNRKQAFENLAHHPWFGRRYAKLKGTAREMALEFLNKHQGATHDQFIPLVNRMFLDMPNKPKNWELALDLLTAASVASSNFEASQIGTQQR